MLILTWYFCLPTRLGVYEGRNTCPLQSAFPAFRTRPGPEYGPHAGSRVHSFIHSFTYAINQQLCGDSEVGRRNNFCSILAHSYRSLELLCGFRAYSNTFPSLGWPHMATLNFHSLHRSVILDLPLATPVPLLRSLPMPIYPSQVSSSSILLLPEGS